MNMSLEDNICASLHCPQRLTLMLKWNISIHSKWRGTGQTADFICFVALVLSFVAQKGERQVSSNQAEASIPKD